MGDLDDQLRRLADRRAERTPVTGASDAMGARPRRGVRRWPYLAAAAFVLLAGVGIAWAVRDSGGFETLEADVRPATQHITLGDHGIEFDIPADWVTDPDSTVWRGDDGYVAIDAAADTAARAAERAAAHQLAPYGTAPSIDPIEVDGRSGFIVRGSEPVGDPVATASVFVEPAGPIVLLGEAYRTLIVTAEIDDIDTIIASLRWLPADEPVSGGDAIDTSLYDAATTTGETIELRRVDDASIVDVLEPEGAGTRGPAFIVDDLLVYASGLSGPPDTLVVAVDADGPRIVMNDIVNLLDVALLDGRATALLARGTAEGGPPADPPHDLFLLDVDTGEETALAAATRVSDGRIIDGRGIAFVDQETDAARPTLRFVDFDGTERWRQTGLTDPGALAVTFDVVAWVSALSTGDGTPTILWLGFDIGDGQFLTESAIEFPDNRTGDELLDGDCIRPIWNDFIWCGRADGPPIRFDLENGIVGEETGFRAGPITFATRRPVVPDPTPTSLPVASRNEVSAPDPLATYDLVAATDEGIELRHRGSHAVDVIPGPAAEIAFLVGDDNEYLVSQSEGSGGTSAVLIRSAEGEYELDVGVDEYHFVYLRDAALVDERPTALITIMRGLVGPDDTFEEVRLVDLESGDMTTLRNENVWETGIDRGFLTDGAIALERGSIGNVTIEVIDYDGNSIWTQVVDDDANVAPHGILSAAGQAAYWSWFDVDDDDRTRFNWDGYDLTNGDQLGSWARGIEHEGRVGCNRLEWGPALWCSSFFDDGGPAQIDLELGIVDPVPGLGDGVITAPHAVSTSFPDRHPCGLGNGTAPHDSLFVTPVVLDDGRTMDVVVWNEGDRVLVQGFLPDWSTNRLDVGLYLHDDASHIAVTPADRADDGFPAPLGGIFTIFLPDLAFDEDSSFPTGFVTWIEFDGCELSTGVSGVVN